MALGRTYVPRKTKVQVPASVFTISPSFSVLNPHSPRFAGPYVGRSPRVLFWLEHVGISIYQVRAEVSFRWHPIPLTVVCSSSVSDQVNERCRVATQSVFGAKNTWFDAPPAYDPRGGQALCSKGREASKHRGQRNTSTPPREKLKLDETMQLFFFRRRFQRTWYVLFPLVSSFESFYSFPRQISPPGDSKTTGRKKNIRSFPTVNI